MDGPLTPQQLKGRVGEDIGVSDWVPVTQDRIDLFAKATDDFQFIHVDPVAAASSPFGGTIAHGFLTLSILPFLVERSQIPRFENLRMELNYGFNKVRFLAPVRSGKNVRARFKLLALDEKRSGEWQETLEVTVEIEGENKPALIAEWMILLFL